MVLDFIEFLLVTNGTKLWYFVILWLRDVCEVSSFFFSGVVLFVGGLLLVGKVIPLVFFSHILLSFFSFGAQVFGLNHNAQQESCWHQ